jgi:hypothetical protein
LRLESVGRDRDELVIDALASGLAQQVLDHPLAFVVLALAEVVVPDPALRVCEVDGRPVPVGEGAPHPVVAVERDRVLDSHGLRGLADVLDLALERELGRMDADDDEPEVVVSRGPRAHEGQRAEPVDAGVRPEIDENDPPTQLRRSERRRIQPAGRLVETREVTLDGQRGRARMAARAEEAHVPRPPAWRTASAKACSCGRLCPMPPAIVRCEYARENFVAQALAAGWCATGITLVEERSPGTRSRFRPTQRATPARVPSGPAVGGMR